MPPKKAQEPKRQGLAEKPQKSRKPDLKRQEKEAGGADDSKKDGGAKKSETAKVAKGSKKRKPEEEPATSRRSGRASKVARIQPTRVQILRFLLSDEAKKLSAPEQERALPATTKTFSSMSLTPFELLASACILSRPISHALGCRSIRTLFNDPWTLNTAKRMAEAGYEKRREALDEARTQHRQKTAEELGMLAEWIVKDLGDESLEKVRKQAGHDVKKEREILKNSIKGIGPTGLDIFMRRVQIKWDEVYPFADRRTLEAVNRLGLPAEEDWLDDFLQKEWGNLEYDGDIREAYVLILERAVGADLEQNVDAVLEAAGSKT